LKDPIKDPDPSASLKYCFMELDPDPIAKAKDPDPIENRPDPVH